MSIAPSTVAKSFQVHRIRLAAYVWSIVRDEQLVEDVLQDVCVIAVQKCEIIRDETHLAEWFRRAARFEALRQLRKRAREPMVLSSETLEVIDQEWEQYQPEDDSVQITALRTCLDMLTPRSRKLLTMRYGDDLKPAQIASERNLKVESVYVALSQIVCRLRECVRQRLAAEQRFAPEKL